MTHVMEWLVPLVLGLMIGACIGAGVMSLLFAAREG